MRYFVLHAPRQTGKTSALIALRDLLNSGEAGDFRCVNVNVEVGQVARDDVAEGIRAILSSLAMSAEMLGDDFVEDVWLDLLAKAGPNNALRRVLARWCSRQRRCSGFTALGCVLDLDGAIYAGARPLKLTLKDPRDRATQLRPPEFHSSRVCAKPRR